MNENEKLAACLLMPNAFIFSGTELHSFCCDYMLQEHVIIFADTQTHIVMLSRLLEKERMYHWWGAVVMEM